MHLLEKEIESQNEKYYKAFDELAQLSSEERITILKYKHQFVPATDFEVNKNGTKKKIRIDFDIFYSIGRFTIT